MSIKEKLKKEGTVKIDVVSLMYIANVLKERQIALFNAAAEAMFSDLSEKDFSDLEDMTLANEIIGQRVLDLIESLIDKETFEKFLNGKLGSDISITMPASGTIN